MVETYPDEETVEAHPNDGLTEFSWDGLATGDHVQITWDRVWNWGGARFKKMAYKGMKGTVVCTQFCTRVFSVLVCLSVLTMQIVRVRLAC
jgi:hypothetical protein